MNDNSMASTASSGLQLTRRQWATELLQKYGLFMFLAILIIAASVSTNGFLKVGNIRDVVKQASPLAIVALGQTLVIISGGLDLSVASLMATSAVAATAIGGYNNAMAVPVIIIVMLMGLCVGGFNGWLVTKRKVSPFLATLATMITLQGIRFAYTGGAPSQALSSHIRAIGKNTLGPIPLDFLPLVALTIIVGLLLYRSSYGRKLYLVGGNPRASFLAGINSDRIITLAYMICGVLAAIAGITLVGYVGNIDNWVGRGMELNSIAAVIMGGATFSGGRGGIWGTLAGVFVLAIVFNYLLLLGLPEQVQYVVQGAVIILASAAYVSRSKSS
jgi:ribose/xylose/arabinose/galactoside ABC-type transport system permease subunit